MKLILAAAFLASLVFLPLHVYLNSGSLWAAIVVATVLWSHCSLAYMAGYNAKLDGLQEAVTRAKAVKERAEKLIKEIEDDRLCH